MSVTNIPTTLIASSTDVKLFNKQTPFHTTGYAYVVLELSSPCHIVNIVLKNAGSAFVTILAGDRSHAKSIRRSLNKKTHFTIFDQMKTIIPETQLISYEQSITKQKIEKIKSFRQFNRLINPRSAVFVCLAVLIRPFVDAQDQSVGIRFVEVYGQIRPEHELTATNNQIKKETENETNKRTAAILSPKQGNHAKKSKIAT